MLTEVNGVFGSAPLKTGVISTEEAELVAIETKSEGVKKRKKGKTIRIFVVL